MLCYPQSTHAYITMDPLVVHHRIRTHRKGISITTQLDARHRLFGVVLPPCRLASLPFLALPALHCIDDKYVGKSNLVYTSLSKRKENEASCSYSEFVLLGVGSQPAANQIRTKGRGAYCMIAHENENAGLGREGTEPPSLGSE